MSSPGPMLCFVVFDGFELLDLTGPYAVLSAAARLAPQSRWRLHVAAAEAGSVVSGDGLAVTADLSLEALAACDLHSLICVGGGAPAIESVLRDAAVMGAVQEAGGRARRVISICSGAFLLAEAGLARQRRMATHWRAVGALARRYQDLQVEPDAIYVQDGPVWSSAGVTAGIDLALALVEQEIDRRVALKIARNLLIPRIRSGGQSQYSADLAAQSDGDTRLARLCAAVRRDPAANWSVDEICDRFQIARRTLTRLCQFELGLPPGQLVERLRLDLARSALVETDAALALVARRSGFQSLQQLERAFQRRMQTSPRAFRARFRTPYAQEIEA